MQKAEPLKGLALVAVIGFGAFIGPSLSASLARDSQMVADMDLAYQAAVKANDAATMDSILHDDFIPTLGNGKVYTRADLLHSAKTHHVTFEQQDEDAGTQTVRLYGSTAIVTARL